jgi:hypothetical protein
VKTLNGFTKFSPSYLAPLCNILARFETYVAVCYLAILNAFFLEQETKRKFEQNAISQVALSDRSVIAARFLVLLFYRVFRQQWLCRFPQRKFC